MTCIEQDDILGEFGQGILLAGFGGQFVGVYQFLGNGHYCHAGFAQLFGNFR